MTAIAAHHMQRKTNKDERGGGGGSCISKLFFMDLAMILIYISCFYTDVWGKVLWCMNNILSTSTNLLKSSVMPVYFYRTYKSITVIIQRN